MRFKKLILAPALLAMGIGALVGCGGSAPEAEFTIWTFSNEMSKLVRKYYSGHNVNVVLKQQGVTQVQTDFEAYRKAGKTLPDILCLEAAVVADYRDKEDKDNPLMPLEDVADLSDMYSYTKEVVTTPDNHLIGLSWQATPGGFFYRSDIAEKIGITTVEQMESTYLNSWENFMNLAALCKTNKLMVLSSITDPIKAFLSERNKPWVTGNILNMESSMFGGGTEVYNCFDVVRALQQNNYTKGTSERDSSYWNDMRSNNVLGFFMSSWGLNFDLMPHATTTAGKWKMCKAPTNYFKGGTWLAVPKGAPHAEAAKEFIKYVTTDKEFLKQRCIETGDFMNSLTVMNQLKDMDLSKSEFGVFLGGQTDHIKKLYEVAQLINGNLISPADAIIDGAFQSACADFAMAGYTGAGTEPYTPAQIEEARSSYKSNFIVQVKKSYSNLIPSD